MNLEVQLRLCVRGLVNLALSAGLRLITFYAVSYYSFSSQEQGLWGVRVQILAVGAQQIEHFSSCHVSPRAACTAPKQRRKQATRPELQFTGYIGLCRESILLGVII